MRATLIVVTGISCVGVSPAVAQNYRGMSCYELWYARNVIYADKGYCFETRRAREEFGRNCFPPYGELTASEQRRVAEIQRWERRKGCR
ncbi:YARHG domain-containing protein [Aurantimonas sp. A2-1-M11]|uniref:YARHG domain-containing protein n=1 Tax=Aurantimonas sp. A2-1-M11 TaxID=3113712 RepID=UPI002F91CD79